MNFNANDVERMIQEQRNFYYTGATRSADFRKAQLENLKQAIVANEEIIIDALQRDLGKSEFEA